MEQYKEWERPPTMGQYKDHALWEEAWKHPPSVKEYKSDWHGKLAKNCGIWVTIRMEPDGTVEIGGRGYTEEAAVVDWWENRLNYFAPEDVYADRWILMLRSAGDPKYRHVRIKGYDDDE